MTLTRHAQHPAYDHSAFLYYSEREYVEWLARFISEGLNRAQPVLVAVPGDRLASLRTALGDAAADVTMADITGFGRNPGRIIAVELDFVQRHLGQHVCIVGEPVWAGRTPFEYPACVQHEALVNIAFADCNATVVCPYDASCLDTSVLADARLTHPLIWQGGSRHHSPDYALDAALDQCNQPLAANPAAVTFPVGEATDLAGARKCGDRYGRLLGMSADRVTDLLLILTELATNSLHHAGGACRLAFWYDAGHVICEARDSGHWNDPLAGRRPPTVNGLSACGLFVVNAIADLVRTYTTSAGTTIHAYLRLDDAREAGAV
ncbi:anti-sigma factor RsbA family regulatory protein [Candidatus Mycobacterium methanotrophicum]|uniref:MEDS domain-containing protein n=1 Tax=Candidatus Mycobacterium methanotrophicum TaxID=2943498 RepID=A0ABY4QM21_9MYCO|nr:anti-sigma factor RsbA family regulatory protein [Candidatus Mycobacterium methanotrophicum]UQX11924.1 MEDS domain-containing protein [Candidatus Mycobacterium methanotrophicum]